MSNEQQKEIPDAVRKIVGAMVAQVLARCDQLGIAHEDFYRAMLEEQKRCPEISVEALFERTFRHLESGAN